MGGQVANFMRVKSKNPEVGDGVTVFHYTDRSAGTVVKVSESGKTAWIRPVKAIRDDNNGMSEVQRYMYEELPDVKPFKVTKRKDGQWRMKGQQGNKVAFGFRDAYHDYSF